MRKGSQLLIEGKIQTRTWDDRESGQKKYRTEILIYDLTLLGGRPEDEGRGLQREKSCPNGKRGLWSCATCEWRGILRSGHHGGRYSLLMDFHRRRLRRSSERHFYLRRYDDGNGRCEAEPGTGRSYSRNWRSPLILRRSSGASHTQIGMATAEP